MPLQPCSNQPLICPPLHHIETLLGMLTHLLHSWIRLLPLSGIWGPQWLQIEDTAGWALSVPTVFGCRALVKKWKQHPKITKVNSDKCAVEHTQGSNMKGDKDLIITSQPCPPNQIFPHNLLRTSPRWPVYHPPSLVSPYTALTGQSSHPDPSTPDGRASQHLKHMWTRHNYRSLPFKQLPNKPWFVCCSFLYSYIRKTSILLFVLFCTFLTFFK